MRKARVQYPTGREVLAAYWGFLGAGGLVIPDSYLSMTMADPRGEQPGDRGELGCVPGVVVPLGAGEGEPILLTIRIVSLRKEYHLRGKIRRKDGQHAVIAFDEGQSQDMMLAAAWADGQDVPERRHRRWNVHAPVRFRTFDREGSGLLVNVSRGGCCLEVDAANRPGTKLYLLGDGFVVDGVVRWAKASNRLLGVEFSRFQEALTEQLVGSPMAAAAGLAAH